MGLVYMVASGKGGTGKTSVSAGLAQALALLGRKVCALDLDAELPNLDLVLGLPEAGVLGLSDVLQGRAAAEEAQTAHPSFPGLFFLAAPDQAEDLEGEAFPALMETLAAAFDYCILDVPAGVGTVFAQAAAVSHRALLVSTADTPCLRDAGTTLAELTRLGVSDVRLVLNMVERKAVSRKNAYNIDQSMDVVGLPLAGVVFRDGAVPAAAHRCKPLLAKHSARKTNKSAARDLMDLAKRLENFPVRPRF